FGWHRWVGDLGDTVGIDRFGMSAPAEQAAAALGLTVDVVVARATAVIQNVRESGAALHG
ncbi:MAG: hypothetical protein H7123_09295, partial [Thermoleophilia bacterium]|nr:hypothetical protein [Thermoleophilia bacterium]